MNWTESESNWDRDGMVARQAWDRLTDDDLADIGGDRDRMLDTLAHRCDLDREEASRRLDDGLDQLQGEGDYAAARDYQQAQHEFAGPQGSGRLTGPCTDSVSESHRVRDFCRNSLTSH